jgi:hypothetical protein
MTGLILPHMLGLDIFSFPHSMSLLFFFSKKKKKKRERERKKLGKKMQNFIFSFDSFSNIACILPNISIHCALIKNAYI